MVPRGMPRKSWAMVNASFHSWASWCAFHLRQVEVRALALVELLLRARDHVEREVGEAAGGAFAVDEDVLLRQVPAARPDDDRGELVVGPQRVLLPALREVDRPVQRVLEVELAFDHVRPQRRVGVLEVGQPDVGAGVERVDRHLLVGGPGDLDPPVDQAGRGRRDPPGRVLADVRGVRQEVEHRPAAQLRLPPAARGEQLRPAGAERVVQRHQQFQGLRGQDLVVTVSGGPGDLHALRHSQLLPAMAVHPRHPAGPRPGRLRIRPRRSLAS